MAVRAALTFNGSENQERAKRTHRSSGCLGPGSKWPLRPPGGRALSAFACAQRPSRPTIGQGLRNTACALSHEYRVLKTPMRSGFTCIFYSKLIQSKIVGKGASIFRLTSKHSLMLTATRICFRTLRRINMDTGLSSISTGRQSSHPFF